MLKNPAELRGYKRAYLVVEFTRPTPGGPEVAVDAGFRSHASDVLYRADDAALCLEGGDHRPPEPGCRCGFYSLKDRRAVERWRFTGAFFRSHPGSSAVLEVGPYGELVIEGTEGFRASRQQVFAAYLDPRCRFCGRKAVTTVAAGPCQRTLSRNLYAAESACQSCAERFPAGRRLSLSQLTALLGTEARFREASNDRALVFADRPFPFRVTPLLLAALALAVVFLVALSPLLAWTSALRFLVGTGAGAAAGLFGWAAFDADVARARIVTVAAAMLLVVSALGSVGLVREALRLGGQGGRLLGGLGP